MSELTPNDENDEFDDTFFFLVTLTLIHYTLMSTVAHYTLKHITTPTLHSSLHWAEPRRRRVSGGVLRFGRPVTPTQTGGAELKPFENSRQQLAFSQLKFAPNMCEK